MFLIGFIDSLGVPLPATMDALLILIAIKAPERAYSTAFLAVLGSVGGNVGLFLASRHGVRRFVKSLSEPGEPQRFRLWFERYGLVTVFIPAVTPLLPLPLKVFVISAGVLHTPLGWFLAVVLVARRVRSFGIAYWGIRRGSGADAFLARNAWTLAAVVVAGAALSYLFMRWSARDRRQA